MMVCVVEACRGSDYGRLHGTAPPGSALDTHLVLTAPSLLSALCAVLWSFCFCCKLLLCHQSNALVGAGCLVLGLEVLACSSPPSHLHPHCQPLLMTPRMHSLRLPESPLTGTLPGSPLRACSLSTTSVMAVFCSQQSTTRWISYCLFEHEQRTGPCLNKDQRLRPA